MAHGSYSIQAPAKLNLGLKVFPRRPDGFHDLQTWMVPLSWHDTLVITPGGPLRLQIHVRAEGIPTDIQKNLVGKAAVALAAKAGIEPTGLIELHKVVPPGGGLGGGSSDAAAALLLLNQVWQIHLPDDSLLDLAAQLGSDVPFFIGCQPAYCTGRGEFLSPMPACNHLFAVLLLPPDGLATKGVFEAFDGGIVRPNSHAFHWSAWSGLTADALNEVLENDLESAAFSQAPWLSDIKNKATNSIGRKVHMTGSGSTLFALCGSSVQASEIKQRLLQDFGESCCCVAARILRQRFGD
jgi:4-diphosphocytidyl-2-C-methyl-D-erythritol kinase